MRKGSSTFQRARNQIPLDARPLLSQFRGAEIMNRIDSTFSQLQDAGKKAFVGYVCAGDPDIEKTLEVCRSLEKVGTDVLELGVPFSDPMADGTVNQQASERALAAGTTVAKVLELVRTLRKESEIAIVLYTYMNPVYAFGFERFFKEASDAGVDGVLLLDLPIEEQDENPELAAADLLHTIRLIAPTTPQARIESIAARAEGFVYYVSREGVTGVRDDVVEGLDEKVKRIKEVSPVPVVVGFGISKPEQAQSVAESADGVVVGSAIVKTIASNLEADDLPERVEALVKPLVDAVKSV